MKIRIANLEDLSLLMEMEAACFTDSWGESGLIEELEGQNREQFPRVFIGEVGGQALAYAIGFYLLEEWMVYRIAVLPAYRNKGYAYAFFSQILALAKEDGVRRVTLEARENNHPALALYKKLGFVEVGRREGFYKDTGEAAVLLDCNL